MTGCERPHNGREKALTDFRIIFGKKIKNSNILQKY